MVFEFVHGGQRKPLRETLHLQLKKQNIKSKKKKKKEIRPLGHWKINWDNAEERYAFSLSLIISNL